MASSRRAAVQQPVSSGLDAKPARSLVAHALNTLGRAIVRGDHQPGTNLPTEPELALSLGVGRNVVREAVKVLTSKQMLKTERRAGTTILPTGTWNHLDQDVIQWSLADPAKRNELIDELTALRFIIEPEVAAMAARNATTSEALRLAEAYEDMQANAHDEAEAISADILFHERLFEACHNQLLHSLVRTVVVVLRANFELSIKDGKGFIRNLEEHGQVADAVHRHDPEAARAAMLRILTTNAKGIELMRRTLADAARSTTQGPGRAGR